VFSSHSHPSLSLSLSRAAPFPSPSLPCGALSHSHATPSLLEQGASDGRRELAPTSPAVVALARSMRGAPSTSAGGACDASSRACDGVGEVDPVEGAGEPDPVDGASGGQGEADPVEGRLDEQRSKRAQPFLF